MTSTEISRKDQQRWPAALAAAVLLTNLSAWGASLTATVNDPAGKPVADAVIYVLPKAGTQVPARVPRPVAVEQKDREFVPYVTPVQVGTTVNFPNRDPLMHHVYSFSPAKRFEIKLYSGDAPHGILFDKPGTATLGCNIHDWMIGYILVVETPWFAKTGNDGRALIGDLVAGEFEVHLWHPSLWAAASPKPLRLDAHASAELAFAVDAPPRKKRFKPPLDGLRYK